MPTATAKSRHRRLWFQHRVTLGVPSCRAPQYFMSLRHQLRTQTCTPFPPPRTTPPRRFAPTDTAKSRQKGLWFQHRITSSVPSCRAPQYFMSLRHQLRTQTCTPFPPPRTTPPRRFAPTATAKSRQRRLRFQHRITSSVPSCRAPQYFTADGYRPECIGRTWAAKIWYYMSC